MMEALNDHFVSAGLNLAKQIDVKPEDDFLKHITFVYVLNTISRLEKGKASGPDKVSITLVRDATICIRTH